MYQSMGQSSLFEWVVLTGCPPYDTKVTSSDLSESLSGLAVAPGSRRSPGSLKTRGDATRGAVESLAPLGGTGALLDAVESVASASLLDVADRLHRGIVPLLGHRALVIFTEECTGRPKKKAGEESVIRAVTIGELDELRLRVGGAGPWLGRASIGGEDRPVFAMTSVSNALLVLIEPAGDATPAAVDGISRLWRVAAARIQEKVFEAPPAYLVESRAASAERARITGELSDEHSTTLETLLAAARSPVLDDSAARSSITAIAASALIRARTEGDLAISIAEEPVASAFERLREDLRPLVRFSGIEVQFIEPPVTGRALPGEVAHAARAIVRGLVLAMVEQPGVGRIRAQWDCDGENLLIEVRDDGPGALTVDQASVTRVQQRVMALDGRMTVTVTPSWGSDVQISMPLDAPQAHAIRDGAWDLSARERGVLELLSEGKANRSISWALGISENTVKFHVRNVFRKLGVSSRAEAIALAHHSGIR